MDAVEIGLDEVGLLPQGIPLVGLLGIAAVVLALYALSWRLSVAWYGKAEQ